MPNFIDIPGLPELWTQTQGDDRLVIAILDGVADLERSCFFGANISQVKPYWQPELVIEPETLATYVEIDERETSPTEKGAQEAEAIPDRQILTNLHLRSHATHVASVLLGQRGSPITGIAPHCTGINIPVAYHEAELLNPLNLVHAINLALEKGAHIIHIATCHPTQTGAAPELLDKAISQCLARNVLLVAPGGNDSGDCGCLPAVMPHVLTVGAMKDSGEPFEFSNFGGTFNNIYQDQGILAPGENIWGARPGSDKPARRKGTSCAAPIVTGVAALLMSLQLRQGATPDAEAIRAALLNSALPCHSDSVEDPQQCLRGKLNIAGAYGLITGTSLLTRVNPSQENQGTEPSENGEAEIETKVELSGEWFGGEGVEAITHEPETPIAMTHLASSTIALSSTIESTIGEDLLDTPEALALEDDEPIGIEPEITPEAPLEASFGVPDSNVVLSSVGELDPANQPDLPEIDIAEHTRDMALEIEAASEANDREPNSLEFLTEPEANASLDSPVTNQVPENVHRSDVHSADVHSADVHSADTDAHSANAHSANDSEPLTTPESPPQVATVAISADAVPSPAPTPTPALSHESSESPNANLTELVQHLLQALQSQNINLNPPVTSQVTPSQIEPSIVSNRVYALGRLDYDFGTEARRDSFKQLMPRVEQEGEVFPANPYDPRQLVDYLDQNPPETKSLIWTLNLDLTPVYVLEPKGAFAAEIYGVLQELLAGQIEPETSEDYIERISIPGQLTDRWIRLFSGQVVPVVELDGVRGLYGWRVNELVEMAMGAVSSVYPQTEEAKMRSSLSSFLNRVYYDLRNPGKIAKDRALNFAATNAFQAALTFGKAIANGMQLDTIDVEKSPYCRLHSDCWDVKLKFFDPENQDRAKEVFRFTIDVVDTIPVTLGEVRSWAVSN
jgi:subtilisin family serine protease